MSRFAPEPAIDARRLQSWRSQSVPQRPPELVKGPDAAWEAAAAKLVHLVPRRRRLLRRAERVLAMRDRYHPLSDTELRERMDAVRGAICRGRSGARDLDQALAMVREVARRTLGLEPYREQIAAALAMHAGCVAEMATGEGKTLAASLLACLHGWRGRGCHVITVNDYLAQRDAESLEPLYRFCGLSVGFVSEEMEPASRRAAYAADITYATNKNVTADYLRDRLQSPGRAGLTASMLRETLERRRRSPAEPVLRGLEVAIVDEADSVLIDEAVTPLIISGTSPNDEQVAAYAEAARLATKLVAGRDYRVNTSYREVRLTAGGRERLAELCRDLGGLWTGRRRSEELVAQALTARELFHQHQHYVIDEGKVVIVDEFTGRLMPDRTWRDGLHQAVEAKEGLEIQPPKGTLARVSFQRFFRMYRRLCGMTGTAAEAADELWRTYRTPVVRIPTHRPCIRREYADRVFGSREAKFQSVCARVRGAHERGRPVLVGTRSVGDSERISELLDEAGVAHRVLNAVRHREEAEIVRLAGQPGAVTIATNMAGRGTDIKLGPDVAAKGGLLLIAAERNDARRIDRQLYGRSGRQGDPGEVHTFVSLEDELPRRYAGLLAKLLRRTTPAGEAGPLRARLARQVFRFAQYRSQRRALGLRRQVLRQDHQLGEQLGFTEPE
ncbi:MAG: DEAD/DEAH box helicase [Phycisphaeraceae bacterium]